MSNSSQSTEVNIGGLLFIVALVVVFLWVWPGVYRYDYMVEPAGLMRVDTLTHEVTMLRDGEFRQVVDISKDNVNTLGKTAKPPE